jgi:CheY-like chemotaxis protein
MSNERPHQQASILVVDDVPENIDVVSGILRDEYKVRAATSGVRCIKIAESDTPPDLILLDIMMPEMDGLEVCRYLQSEEKTRDIPIIFITAKNEVDDVVNGLKIGAVDYVTKPVEPSILKARVKTHVRLKQVNEQLRKDIALALENAQLREDVERITQHDLKNPLGIIMGFSEMMKDDAELSEDIRESAGYMEEAAYKMLSMINSSLDLYKMEKGTYSYQPEKIDIVKVIKRVFLELESVAMARGVILELEAQNSKYTVIAEELLCHSLMANLIRNAIEASSKDDVVKIKINQQDDIHISISNPSMIPVEIQQHFFEKYATAGKQNGTGLGTYSAKLLVTIQKGSVDFITNEHDGTTLNVILPGES